MLLLIFAVALVVIGHLCKVKRWCLYIAVYEKPSFGNLLSALSVGHIINAVFPFRIGDLFRFILAGRSLKNSYSFSISTVIVDLYIDLITVGCMFFGLASLGKGGNNLKLIAYFYMIAFLIIIPVTIFAILYRSIIKKIIVFISGFFNENINFRILYLSYLIISALKDIRYKISKIKFCFYTFLMWGSYVSAYMIFAEFLQKRGGGGYTTSDVFASLFSNIRYTLFESDAVLYWMIFLIVPLVLCLFISFFFIKDKKAEANLILPQLNKNDRFAFLKMYFSEENREHIKPYLEINKDVTVIQDSSAGSNASTVVILKNESMFYRKYAFDEDGDKLAEQIAWIEANQNSIPLPCIADKRFGQMFVTYDMPCYTAAVGFFRYIHTMPIQESWKILKQSLDDIHKSVHQKNKRKSDRHLIEKYIETKHHKNLEIIRNCSYIAKLEKNEKIIVNGQALSTLSFYEDIFDTRHLEKIFENDEYSEIHGDLTIENIVCLLNDDELNKNEFEGKVVPKSYYFIDPNIGNLHDSPFLDYAKLLQSLHGCYEFLMMVSDVTISQNTVSFMTTVSENYREIYKRYKKYLEAHFSKNELLSIYYHEIIHWLRLIPYKIRKNEKLAVVFYAGLLAVLKDVWEMEHE